MTEQVASQIECANWDLTSYFDVFGGAQYCRFRDDLKIRMKSLQERTKELVELRETNLSWWVQLLMDMEELLSRGSHIDSYLGCLSAADSRNEEIRRERAGLAVVLAEQEKIDALILEAFRNASDRIFEMLLKQPRLEGASYFLQRMRIRAKYTMSAPLETLTAELGINGLSAWGRLYDEIAGRLEFDLKVPDGKELPKGLQQHKLSMALKRSLTENADPVVRKAALEGSNLAWEEMEDVTAASLNAIAGTRLTLYKWRGVKHFLNVALFDAAISHKTLDTMFAAIASRRDVCHRYLHLKTRLIGKKRLGFQDLACPLPLKDAEPIHWDRAKNVVLEAFGSTYPALRDFTAMAFEKRWIDYEPRQGRRPGAFCSSSSLIRESRIFMTYNNTIGDIETLSHEIGHAFHSWVMRDLRSLARIYPMTLAETASNFAETVLTDAILEDRNSSDRKRAIILNARLDHAATYLLNIHMRFLFERRFYEERAEGEVSVSRLKELMLQSQRECYGDCLAEGEMDPYFWASKLHFYITELSFYNFPYAFGYLFNLGIFARLKKEGPSFLSRYEEVLRLSGSDTAENVAQRALGVDLGSPEFWLESISMLENDLEQFEMIIPKVLGTRGQ